MLVIISWKSIMNIIKRKRKSWRLFYTFSFNYLKRKLMLLAAFANFEMHEMWNFIIL